MKYIINAVYDLEDIMIESLKNYIFNDVRFREIYPQFGDPRIGIIHPFAYLIDTQLNQTVTPSGLFPSVTLVDDSDTKDQQADMATLEDTDLRLYPIALTDISSDLADPVSGKGGGKKYIISQKSFDALQKISQTPGAQLYATGMNQRRRTSIVSEIWDRNPIVKNRLYDIVRNFLIGTGRFTLYREKDILIDETSISGQKSGNYNFDFGYMIHGGILRFEAVHIVQQFVVDTEIDPLAGAEVEVNASS